MGPWRTDRAQQGSCSLWGSQLRGTSDFLGSKLQGAEERDPGVCGAVQSGDPQDVPPWGGQPRGSPPHCVLLANREMGSSVPRAQARGPSQRRLLPRRVLALALPFFSVHPSGKAPRSGRSRSISCPDAYSLPQGEVSGTGFFSPSHSLLAATAAHPGSTSIPLREMASTAPAAW